MGVGFGKDQTCTLAVGDGRGGGHFVQVLGDLINHAKQFGCLSQWAMGNYLKSKNKVKSGD